MILGLSVAYAATYCFSLVFLADFSVETDGWQGYLPTDFGPRGSVRWWYDRFRADGLWADAAAQLTRAVREQRNHAREPSTGLLDSQSVASGPQKGCCGI